MKRKRSPNFPGFSLSQSVGLAEKFYKSAGQSPIKERSNLAIAIGYKSLNGASVKAIGSLNAYGLIEKSDNGYRISEIGLKIIKPISESDRKLQLRSCALRPKIFASIFEKYSGLSKEMLSRTLLHGDFTEDGAIAAANAYKDNEEFVGGFDSNMEIANDNVGKQDNAKIEEDNSEIIVDKNLKSTPINEVIQKPKVIHEINSQIDMFPIPLDFGKALIPRGISEDDFNFLIQALNLYKRKIISKEPMMSEQDI